MRLYGEKKEADARTAPSLADARGTGRAGVADGPGSHRGLASASLAGGSASECGPGRMPMADACGSHGRAGRLVLADGSGPHRDRRDRPGRDDPQDWDDVLLPDDELPVGVPAAAHGVEGTPVGPADVPPGRAVPQAHDASADPARGNLLLMTCLGAADGTILLLAATGKLASLTLAIVVGLTVVSGIGAWIAAYAAFGGRRHGRRDYTVLARMAGISIAATIAAAWLGVAIGQAVTFHVLPKAVGVVLFLIAAEIWGLRLPRVAHVPLPLAAVAIAAIAEVALWIP